MSTVRVEHQPGKNHRGGYILKDWELCVGIFFLWGAWYFLRWPIFLREFIEKKQFQCILSMFLLENWGNFWFECFETMGRGNHVSAWLSAHQEPRATVKEWILSPKCFWENSIWKIWFDHRVILYICEQNKYMIIWSLYDDSSHTYTSDATCNSHLFYLSFVFGFAMYHSPVLSEARHRQYRETPVPHVSGCPAEVCVEVRADIVALRSWFQRLLSVTPLWGRFPFRLRFFKIFKNQELFKREWSNYLLLERSTKSASVAGKFEYFPLMLL